MNIQKEIDELTILRDQYEFKRKRALHQDYFFDAEKHEASRDLVQEQIDCLREKINVEDQENTRNSSNYIECLHCKSKVHQNRLYSHRCKVTPIERRLRYI